MEVGNLDLRMADSRQEGIGNWDDSLIVMILLAQELKTIELERYWNPLLYIDNIITETKDSCWLTAVINSRAETYIMERRRTKGIFLENLELNDFPLDVQVCNGRCHWPHTVT